MATDGVEKIGQAVEDIGAYIRRQREGAEVSLRQLAKVAGISNPYLSQIERGLRKPSAEILAQIATGLRIGTSLTLLGVLIGEMFASQRGLGFLITNAIGLNDTATILAMTLLASAAIAPPTSPSTARSRRGARSRDTPPISPRACIASMSIRRSCPFGKVDTAA